MKRTRLKRKRVERKPAKSPKKKKRTPHIFSEHIDADVRNESHRNQQMPESLEKFVKSISAKEVAKPPAIIHLLEKMYLPKGETDNQEYNISNNTTNKATESNSFTPESDIGIMKEKLLQYSSQQEVLLSLENAENKPILTSEDIDHVNSITVEQWKCQQWYVHKAGIISASKVKRVIHVQSKLESGEEKNVRKLVDEIVNPSIPPHICSLPDQPKNPRDWGLKHEATARNAYYKIQDKQHINLKLESKGLMISKNRPFLGASVDNIRICECEKGCPRVVVEYKCPWKHRDLQPRDAFLTPEVGGQHENDHFSLKTNCQYYFQVQMQMFIYNIMLCDFVVWTKHGIFAIEIPFDSWFMNSVVDKLQRFWINHVLPLMMFQNKSESTEEHTIEEDTDIYCRKNNVPNLTSSPTAAPVMSIDDKATNVTSKIPVMSIYGINIYQKCIDGLQPHQMLNDNIVTYLLEDAQCNFPIVSTFWYTVLCGEQEGRNKQTRLQRNIRAKVFFTPDMLKEEYIFIPINRKYHWLLAVITPWHLLIMDSLTWQIDERRKEISIILSYLEYLVKEHQLPKKHVQLKNKVLKVPQQHPGSNNCGIFVSKFVQNFLEDLEFYESKKEEYCTKEHDWFNNNDVEKKRAETKSFLQNLFNVQQFKKQLK